MLKKAIILLALTMGSSAYGQTLRTYIQDIAVKVPGITNDSLISTLASAQKRVSRTYYDGLGRPIQQIGVMASPLQNDIIQPMVYDSMGRQSIGYLPYAGINGSGGFRSAALTDQHIFYNGGRNSTIARDSMPYNHQLFENSPMQRVLQSGSVGAGFQPGQHYKSMDYGSNTVSDSVRLFLPNGNSSAIYTAGKLTYARAVDEQGVTTTVFTDDMGKTILKRQLGPSAQRIDTYYIYNNNGSVAYVVPPRATQLMKSAGTYNISVTGVDKLLFKYQYDSQARLTIKTVPAAGDMYVVYDPLERPVLMQDANLRTADKWNYIKYDMKGRAVAQGIYVDHIRKTLAGMQAHVDSVDYSTYYAEARSTSSTYGWYTNNVFPNTNIEPLAYSYFDDYHITNTNTPDYTYNGQGLSGTADTLVNGMMTAVRKRTVGTGIVVTWLTTVTFYDSRGRTLETQGNNLLYATVADKATVQMDFTGKPTITKVVKNKSGSSSITVQTVYTYDSSDRVTAVDQGYNGATAKRIAAYAYNELGQLIKKNLGRLNSGTSYPYDVTKNSTITTTTHTIAQNRITLSNGFHATAGSSLSFTAQIKTDYLQGLDYRYNIRGQLLSMNNSTLTRDTSNNDDGNDVFGMEMLYDTYDAGIGNTRYYNGRLSAVKWMSRNATGQKTAERNYNYTYDLLNRMTDADYQEKISGTWNSSGAFNEKSVTYDENGNIKTLKRNSLISGTVTAIDDLNYSYDGNRLTNVTDGSGTQYTANGFKNLAAYAGSTPYAYDDNGNLVTDLKKGITNHYNILNRVDSIRVTAGTNQWITYTYDATGVLLRKKQYKTSATTPVMVTDYVDGFVFENDTLKYFAAAEGRVRVSGSTLTNEYVITDTQGNSRVSLEDNGSGAAVVRQENSYYPFGLIMSNGITPSTDPNKNLYNGGSEWQNDYVDLPDYYQTFFRNYDAAIGRFVGVDPMAHKAESWTTYQYAFNNPGMLNDPMGDMAEVFASDYENAADWQRAIKNKFNDNIDHFLGIGSYLPTEGVSSSSGGGTMHLTDPVSFIRQLQTDHVIDFNKTTNTFGYTTGGVEYDKDGRPIGAIATGGTFSISAFDSANQGGNPHAAELAKYGQISWGYNFTAGGSAGALGGLFETGTIVTNKGWARQYKTVYYAPGMSSPSASHSFFKVFSMSDQPLPTFSDWNGLSKGVSGSFDFVAFGIGLGTNYSAWSLGGSFAPEALNFMKETRGGGGFVLGITTWVTAPYRLNDTPYSNAYYYELSGN